MYSSSLSLTSVVDWGGWSMSRPGRFTPGKYPVPIVQEAGWASGSDLNGSGKSHLRTVQPVASRYTDYATRPTVVNSTGKKLRIARNKSEYHGKNANSTWKKLRIAWKKCE